MKPLQAHVFLQDAVDKKTVEMLLRLCIFWSLIGTLEGWYHSFESRCSWT